MTNILSLSTLSLHHFRNYTSTRLNVEARPVVLFGHNGAGKTNILEAISLLSPGRGLRGAKLVELSYIPSPLRGEGQGGGEILVGDREKNLLGSTPHLTSPPKGGRDISGWVITAHIHGAQGEVMIGTGKDNQNESDTPRREVRIDGKPANAMSDLAAHVRMLWLTPQMEQLFQESNSEGRKFLDRIVYYFDTTHSTRVNAYEQAMRERNRLLESGRADPNWLSALEHTMAEKACAIASARLSALDYINNAIGESSLSFTKPHVAVSGIAEDLLAKNYSALEVEEKLAATFFTHRNQDAAAGRTLAGTHRSELVVTHKKRGTPASQCSTGEQKALLLSIILAQSRSGTRWNGITPIILLDEVVAHLDPVKRLELFEEICESRAQVWMTGTDASLFDGIKQNAQMFEVENGKII